MTGGFGDDTMGDLSEISGRVARTGERVGFSKYGIPLAGVHPVEPNPDVGSSVWRLRKRFVEEHGDIDADLELPPRNGERFENPF